jgi:hypothetical protein
MLLWKSSLFKGVGKKSPIGFMFELSINKSNLCMYIQNNSNSKSDMYESRMSGSWGLLDKNLRPALRPKNWASCNCMYDYSRMCCETAGFS